MCGILLSDEWGGTSARPFFSTREEADRVVHLGASAAVAAEACSFEMHICPVMSLSNARPHYQQAAYQKHDYV